MRLALVGNPSVGKSLIFHQLTGIGVEVSNYPGTTVELERGTVCHQRERVELVDLPGVYSLDGTSNEETLVRTVLTGGEVDAAIVVLNATRFERNLYLLLQIAETGIPMVAVVNLIDEAEAAGIEIDTGVLAEQFGVEVVATAAVQGRDIDRIVPLALKNARPSAIVVPYAQEIEAAVRTLQRIEGSDRSTGLRALQGLGEDPDLVEAAGTIATEIESSHQMSVTEMIAANRHRFAHQIAEMAVQQRGRTQRFDLDQLLTRTIPGIPILVAIIVGMLLVVFTVGSALEGLIVAAFEAGLAEPVAALPLPPLVQTILSAIVLALEAGLGIAFPFIFTFYLLHATLEDSGYMTRAAFLADRAMHHLGLHGRAVIPLVLAFGCNVPAVMSAATLQNRRERFIAAFLASMVPCSARTVIISGIVAAFVSIPAAFSIYGIVLLIVLVTGLLLARTVPGERFGMILEMAPLRYPVPGLVIEKSWRRIREFLVIALPLLVAGSVALTLLDFFGVLAAFQQLASPLSEGVLGLPAYATTALLFGILRKEMAFETLAVLAGTANLASVMSSVQLYVFALVSTLFVPCISTIAVLNRQLGSRAALGITVYTVVLGIVVGAIVRFALG